jgi:peptidoglycan/LPS O-acetylase OafA/YrhL
LDDETMDFRMQPDNRAHRYEALDGLRGVAALTVLAAHCGLLLDIYRLPNALVAVDTFFVISGFVIAHSYDERLRRGMPASEYLYRRVVRLYPMFIIGLLIGAVVLYYGDYSGAIAYPKENILSGVLPNLFYLPFFNGERIYFNFEVGQVFPANPPAWSLFSEMLASGAFLLLFGLRRRPLVLVSALCYIALVAAGVYYANIKGGSAWVDIHNGWGTKNFFGALPRVGFSFSFGVLLHALSRDRTGQRIQSLVERIPYPSFVLYGAALAMLLFSKSIHGLYPLLAVATVGPAIVFVGAHTQLRSGFERNIATFLGWISYPVYCLHYPVVRLVIFLRDGKQSSGYFLLAVTTLVTLVLAVVLTRWYEEPVRAALSGLWPARARLRIAEEDKPA